MRIPWERRRSADRCSFWYQGSGLLSIVSFERICVMTSYGKFIEQGWLDCYEFLRSGERYDRPPQRNAIAMTFIESVSITIFVRAPINQNLNLFRYHWRRLWLSKVLICFLTLALFFWRMSLTRVFAYLVTK